jgi:hypothetical protein
MSVEILRARSLAAMFAESARGLDLVLYASAVQSVGSREFTRLLIDLDKAEHELAILRAPIRTRLDGSS